jgi:hypothetical protein
MSIGIAVSPGELVDRITILELKVARLTSLQGRQGAARELAALRAVYDGVASMKREGLDEHWTGLREVNGALWEIEDALRACEQRKDFGAGFVELARSVYRNNDARAALKAKINDACGSSLREEKSYTTYDGKADVATPSEQSPSSAA